MSNEIVGEISRQFQGASPESFLCATCKKYDGALKCRLGIFIAFEGANMSLCQSFEQGRKCPHCGKMI